MPSTKEVFCKELETRLMDVFQDAAIVTQVMDQAIITLNDYDVVKCTTELVPYEGRNDKIMKRYTACLRLDGKAERTVSQYANTINKLQYAVGKNLDEIGTYDIRFYLASIKENGVSNVTLKNYLHYISTFFAWMENEGMIDKSPCKAINTIKTKKEIKLPLSDAEVDILRSSCRTKRERALMDFLLSTGIRVNELVNVRVQDLNFQHLSVHIKEGKGGKERIAYFNEVTAMRLKDYMEQKQVLFGYVFYSQRGHGQLTTNAVRDLLARLGDRAGVEDVHPHKFRRTFATNMYKRGMDVREIQHLMGHSNLETTMGYIYTDSDHLETVYKQHAM